MLGWDPGVKYLGYGVLELTATRSLCRAHGVLGDKLGEMPALERLDELAFGIDGIVNTWMPEAIGYEDQTGVSIAMEADGAANMMSRRIHEVTGMIRMAARCGLADAVPCYCPQSRSIKVALLGKGHSTATKAQMQWGVQRLFGVKTNQHACDAIACAVTTARMHRIMAARRQTGCVIT